MKAKILLGFLFLFGSLLSSACGLTRPQIATVDVADVVQQTQVVTAEVTRIVRETQVVTVEVTRIVRETVVVTLTPSPNPSPTPLPKLIDITQGAALGGPRSHHTATRLPDGKILLVGGSQGPNEPLASVEIFDPVAGSIAQVASLHTPRHDHSATLLPDGRVLIIGGYSLPQQWLSDAEVYDLSTNTWTVVPPLYSHGVSHSATLMSDGRVLVVGGCTGSGVCTERVEIFDPQDNSWIDAAPLKSDRASQAALSLDDGRVLVVGGQSAGNVLNDGDALLYDPQTNTWADTGPMVAPRIFAQITKLLDGRVLVAGGMTLKDAPVLRMTASVEIYNPTSNTWASAASLSRPRYAFILTLLPDGQVWAIGGAYSHENKWGRASFVRKIESYDAVTDNWRAIGELPQPGACAAAAFLPDGHLWVTGGQAGQSKDMFLSSTWLMAPLPTLP